MIINKAVCLYFSPTGNTHRAVAAFAFGTGLPREAIDLTTPRARASFSRAFARDELAVIGLPVYAGRLPPNMEPFFCALQGNGATAVAIVTYGNREYDDALLELQLKLEECGFKVRAAAAFIGEHSLSRKIATDRPDAADLRAALDFGKQTVTSIAGGAGGRPLVKGNHPFTAKGAAPLYRPVTAQNCLRCGLCVDNCPFGAISAEDCATINVDKCFYCFRCVKYCPVGAKQFTDEKFLAWLPGFEARLNARRREPELFLPA